MDVKLFNLIFKFKKFILKVISIKELKLILYSVFFLFVIKFLFDFGPFYTSDTIDYLKMANDVSLGFFPHSPSFSPGYPFLIGLISKLFVSSGIKSVFYLVFIFIFLSVFITYRIVKLIYRDSTFTFQKGAFISFVFLSHWAIFKILITAHADALFLVLLLVYFLFLFLWLSTFKVKWFIFTTFFAGMCIWIKYNGLILIPFLIFSSLIFGKNKFKLYILGFPIITAFTSYFTFSIVNGTVIKHFKSELFINKIEVALYNYDLLYYNLVLSGRVFVSAIFTRSIQLLMPDWFCIVFLMALLYLVFKYFLFSKNSMKIENALLLFTFFYWIVFIILNQYAAYNEIGARTMFPSILSFYLWLLIIFKSLKKSKKYVVAIILILNIIYSFYYVIVLNYNTDKKNTIQYVADFSNRKSVIELKKLQKNYNFNDRIYTNEYRNLLYAFNYRGINIYPSRKVFINGSFRDLNDQQYDKIQQKFWDDFSASTSVVLLIDCPKFKSFKNCVNSKKYKIFHIGQDVLIINVMP